MNELKEYLPERNPQESFKTYVRKMCRYKAYLHISWQELADIINEECGLDYSESYYRRGYQKGKFEEVGSTTVIPEDTYPIEDSEELDELLELKKAKIKLSDERVQNNVYVRKLAREETLREIAADYAATMSKEKLLPAYNQHTTTNELEGILLLSDWHYGMTVDNAWNLFNPDICRARVSELVKKVRQHLITNKIEQLTVLNLSDLIAGRIHAQIRIESRIDVITQTMDVAEILAEVLTDLSQICNINYYDCLDNHSRLEPNKANSLDLESLVRIIPWYLKKRLANNSAINILDNEFGPDIITCNVAGHNIIAVHGDQDKPATALERLSLMTHKHYDLLCTAHLHHFSADEQHQSMIISNASLMGVDSYAEKLRLTSYPSQTLILATKENVCECIYRIVLTKQII